MCTEINQIYRQDASPIGFQCVILCMLSMRVLHACCFVRRSVLHNY